MNKGRPKTPGNKKVKFILWVLLFIFLLVFRAQASSTQTEQVHLSAQEIAFLKAHPVIRLGTDSEWDPYVIRGIDGSLMGMDVDFIDHINKVTGANIKLVTGRWIDMVEKALNHEIDGLANSAPLEERQAYFNFSDVYVSEHSIIVLPQNSPLKIQKRSDLSGKRIAIQNGNLINLKLLEKIQGIEIVTALSVKDSVRATLDGRADACILSSPYYPSILKIFGKSIRIGFVDTNQPPVDVVYSIRKDWPELVSIINKSLASLSRETLDSFYMKWFGMKRPERSSWESNFSLSPEERFFLEKHPVVRLAIDPSWPPFEFIDETANYRGISLEYIRRFEEMLGIRFQVPQKQSWAEMVRQAEHGELDMYSAVLQTPRRLKYMDFTPPYLSFPMVVVTGPEISFIGGLDDLKGKKIAVERGSAVQDILADKHSDLHVTPFTEISSALDAVAKHDYFCYIGNLAAISHTIRKESLVNLKISGELPYRFDIQMAVRKDWPELLSIIQKALDAIPDDEHRAIYNSWISVKYEKRTNHAMLIKIIVGVTVTLLVVFLWNRRLALEVKRRTQVERQLLESQHDLQVAQKSTKIGSWRWDIASDKLHVSEELKNIFWLDQGPDLTFKEVMTFVHPDDRRRLKAAAISLKTKSVPLDLEFCITADGRSLKILHGKAQVEKNSKDLPVLMRGTVHDITDQKGIEEQLRQAQKMEAVGTLAGGIAHDFNNILSAIIGFADLSLLDTSITPSLQKNLNRILQAGIRARDLVEQILTFSRQDNHNLIPLHVGPLVKEALKMLRSTLPTTITFQNHLDPNLGAVMASPTQIHQIVMNLCTNAAQSMEERGGTLETSLKEVLFHAGAACPSPDLKPGRYLELTVRDTGTGIAPENLKNIFDPYFTTKVSGQGTGLGLAVVHGIVKEYQGAITVNSTLGKGSEFHVFIPVIDALPTFGRKIQDTLPKGYESIMVIDDESILAELASDMLGKLGYRCTTYSDSIMALEDFQEEPDAFNLVLTDMTMPGLSGEILAEEMLKVRCDIPIIIYTGYSSKLLKKSPKDLGVEAILMKPLQQENLAKTIREILDRKRSQLPARNSSHH